MLYLLGLVVGFIGFFLFLSGQTTFSFVVMFIGLGLFLSGFDVSNKKAKEAEKVAEEARRGEEKVRRANMPCPYCGRTAKTTQSFETNKSIIYATKAGSFQDVDCYDATEYLINVTYLQCDNCKYKFEHEWEIGRNTWRKFTHREAQSKYNETSYPPSIHELLKDYSLEIGNDRTKYPT